MALSGYRETIRNNDGQMILKNMYNFDTIYASWWIATTLS